MAEVFADVADGSAELFKPLSRCSSADTVNPLDL